MRDIRELDCSEEFRRSNFGLTEMEVQAGPIKRKSPMYLMTRDGFTFLAMGFTGARAAEFKEKYIAEFNRMEQHIRDNMTTSLKVAEVFRMLHKNVMQAIELLDCYEEFRKLNFQLTEMEIQAGPVKRKSP